MMNDLPRTIEELTPAWLTAALAIRCPGIQVVSADVDHVIWGTATKILMTLKYADNSLPQCPPGKLCVKGEFDEKLRATLSGVTLTGTQVEAMFLNDIAPQLGIPLLPHWYGASEPGMGIIILSNANETGITFGSPVKDWSPDMVAKGLEILARLHASTWGNSFAAVEWLTVGSEAVRQVYDVLMTEQHWASHFKDPLAFQLRPGLQDRERVMLALRALWAHNDTIAHSLIHGDAHLGNTCIDASGQPYFIDWAGPCRSSWAFDVAYFMSGALSVANRRTHETDLVSFYLDALAGHGGPALDRTEAWLDYRRNHLNGLIWATLPSTLQPVENVHAMSERYTTAINDHGSIDLLLGR